MFTDKEKKALVSLINKFSNHFSNPMDILSAQEKIVQSKPIPEPVTGWEAVEDMRKNPEARYSVEDQIYKFKKGRLMEEYVDKSAEFRADFTVQYLSNKNWVKVK